MGNAKTTRERILGRGVAMASRSGLEGVTLGTLADAVGMSKSGLFAHFHSKEAVQISVLEHSLAVGAPIVVEPAMREPEGVRRLSALVKNWFGWAPRAGLPGGCPVAAGMFEYDDVDGPVREKIAEMEANWRGVLREQVQRAIDNGEFREGLDVEQFVYELNGIYLGHHTAARFLKAPDADRRAATAFSALLERAQKPVTRKTASRVTKRSKSVRRR